MHFFQFTVKSIEIQQKPGFLLNTGKASQDALSGDSICLKASFECTSNKLEMQPQIA